MGGEAMTLVDASSWIEFLRGRDSVSGQRVKTLLARGDAAWCDMTLVELWNGAQGSEEKRVLEELESELRLYPVNAQVWAGARILARRCREKCCLGCHLTIRLLGNYYARLSRNGTE